MTEQSEERARAAGRRRGPSRPLLSRVDRDLLERWLTPEGVTALLALTAAVVAAVTGVVSLVTESPGPAILVLGLVALPLTSLGLYLAVRVTDGRASARPPDPPPFAGHLVGRDGTIAAICQALRDRTVVSIAGRRGVGTSACANKATEVLSEAPLADMAPGTVYLDLRRGHVPSAPDEVLAGLARSLGVEGITDAAHLRGRLSEERRLLVLDNADHVSQVSPLLPGAGQLHKLLVAGTVTLANIEPIEVLTLRPADAARILSSTGRLRDGRWPQLEELAELCGCQPRVLAAAGDLIHKQRYDLDGLLAAVHRVASAPPHVASNRLLNEAEHDLQFLAEQDVAYAGLSGRARKLLRRLALMPALPGPELESVGATEEGGRLTLCRVDGDTMAVVAGLRDGHLLAARNELADAGFLGEAGEVRSIRPLHAPLARLHLVRDEPPWVRRRAYARLLKHLARESERHADTRSTDNNAWFERNEVLLRGAVIAAGSPSGDSPGGGPSEPLPPGARRWWFRLAVALCVWYAAEGRLDEWLATCDAVERLPRRARQLIPSDGLERAWRTSEAAAIARRSDRLDEAERLLAAAAEAMPDWRHLGEAQISTNQALVLERRAQQLRDGGTTSEDRIRPLLEQALAKLEEARPLRARSDTIGQALTDQVTGLTYRHLARSDTELAEAAGGTPHPDGTERLAPDRDRHLAEARRHLVRAADRFREAGELRGEAAALTDLVLVAGEMRSTGIALRNGEVALRRYDELKAQTGRDDVAARAAVLLNLGAVLVTADEPDPGQARRWLEQSLGLRGAQASRGLGRTHLYLGDAEMLLANEAVALSRWSDARRIFTAAGDRDGLAAVERRLAAARPEAPAHDPQERPGAQPR